MVDKANLKTKGQMQGVREQGAAMEEKARLETRVSILLHSTPLH